MAALSRPPCLISFSGGLDSSAILCLAVHVARREGLPAPVPVSLRFPADPASEETDAQRLVLRHLGLDSWTRVRVGEELDLVGPYARTVLRRHGLTWPANLHFHLPIVQLAAGGTVLTGFGGDEVGRSSSVLAAERQLRLRSGGRGFVAFHRYAPRAVKRVREGLRRENPTARAPYLTRLGRLRLRAALTGSAAQPFGWGALLRESLWRDRYVQVARECFRIMAAPYDVEVRHPFVEPELLACLGEGDRWAGMNDRARLLERLLGDVLPPSLLARTSKAAFDGAAWTDDGALRFARDWSGTGLDPRVVDPEAVRRTWLGPDRTAMTATLLQAAWLADETASGRAQLDQTEPLELRAERTEVGLDRVD